MQKEFLSNIFFLLLINVLIKPFYILGIDAQVQNAVGDQAYGLYFVIFDFCFLFQVLLDLGIQNYNSKHVSEYRETVSEHFSIVLGLKIFLLLVFFVAIISAAYVLGYPESYFPIILMMGLIMTCQTFYVYLRSHLSALGFFKTDSLLSALDKLLMIAIIGYMLYVLKDVTIHSFMMAQVVALCLAIVVAFIFLRQKFSLGLSFSIEKWKAILKKSLPFSIVFILMTLYTRMDGVMLERLLHDEGLSAGYYAKGFRLMDAANMIGFLFAMLLLPMYARLLHEKHSVKLLLSTAAQLQFCIASILAISCWYYAQEILDLLYVNVNDDTVISFKFLMISFWAMAMSYIYGSLITASGRLKRFNMIFIVGIIINWGLNLLLIPKYTCVGAAIATVITQVFVFMAQFILVYSRYDIGFNATTIIKVLILLGIYFATATVLNEYISLFWIIEIVIFAFISLLASFLSGFLRLHSSFVDEITN